MSEAVMTIRALGVKARRDVDVVKWMREGLPSESLRRLEGLLKVGHSQLAPLLGLPERTLARRLNSRRLPADDSDRVFRIARIYCAAVNTLGTPEKALRWLNRSNQALGGVAPLGLLDTEAGARSVESVLGAIRYGMVS